MRRLALLVLLALALAPGIAHAAAERPNFVVLMTDDQTVDDLSAMPETRRLIAARGATFRDSFVSYSLCCPSRATLLTGQYAHNHGVMGLGPPTGGVGRLDTRNDLPVWLTRAGYHTAYIGKFLNGYGTTSPAVVPPGWSEWYGAVDPTTYNMWGFTLNENGRLRTYGSPFDEAPGLYQTDVYRRKAVDLIERRANRRKPFFLSVAFLAPHHEAAAIRGQTGVTVRPAPRHRGVFAARPLPRPGAFDEADMSDKPAFLRDRRPRITPEDAARITRNYHNRQESLLAVDDAVRSIVHALAAEGELRQTYILFTSDNGFMQGEHRVPTGKMLPYEPSIRVPLLLRGPHVPAGVAAKELVWNGDIAPTILGVARARAGKRVDGRSLLPYARHPHRRSRRPILLETGGLKPGAPPQDQDAGPFEPPRRIMTYKGVRTARFKWVEYRNGARELYDLWRDPQELRSRHRDPRYRRTRTALHRALARLKHCRGAGCRRGLGRVPAPR
jgi:N-acetylglucosamine-6-sulfatase